MLYSPSYMHIPDGFLSAPVSIGLWAISAVVIGYALKRVGKDLGERQVPLMGVLAACIFAGQMLNFTIAGGTSGHLLGAALAVILLGPWAAIIVLTCVVSIQALVFQDGGLVALGANLFNMAVVGVFVAHAVYRTAQKFLGGQKRGQLVSGFAAAWASIFIAALACALELALSGTSPANIVVPAMGGIHMLIGIGEGLITVGALAFLLAARRDLLQADATPVKNSRVVWGVGLDLALGLAVLSPLASAYPDGLEWVAGQNGFLRTVREPLYQIVPDYVMPGIPNEALATIAAGLLGTLIVFGVALGVAASRKAQKSKTNAKEQF